MNTFLMEMVLCQGKEEGLFHLQIWELAVPQFLHQRVFKVQQISRDSNKGGGVGEGKSI